MTVVTDSGPLMVLVKISHFAPSRVGACPSTQDTMTLSLQHTPILSIIQEDRFNAHRKSLGSSTEISCFSPSRHHPPTLSSTRSSHSSTKARKTAGGGGLPWSAAWPALNVRSQGGAGDAPRTLRLCRRLVDDHDDMMVKAMSWALRELVAHDPDAVRTFLADYEHRLAARVKREVSTDPTGVKPACGIMAKAAGLLHRAAFLSTWEYTAERQMGQSRDDCEG